MIVFKFHEGIFSTQSLNFCQKALNSVNKMIKLIEKNSKFNLIKKIVQIKNYIIILHIILLIVFLIFIIKGKNEDDSFFFKFGLSMIFVLSAFLILLLFFLKNYFIEECQISNEKIENILKNYNKNILSKFEIKAKSIFKFNKKIFFNYPHFKIEIIEISSINLKNNSTVALLEEEEIKIDFPK